jgi:glycosyltransferase involved in cell wall biosynthesis
MFNVVMPLYNKQEFVAATIEAVLAQSYRDWRLFVVDDGSTDRSAEVVRGFDDPRITIIEQANCGVGPARNAGIAAGTAEWIAFLDADDVWNADHLAELEALRCAFPKAALIGCAFKRFSGATTPKVHSEGGPARRLARYFAECARGRELLVTSSAAVPRLAIEEVGAFKDLPGNEDVELWARLALHGPVAVSARQTVNYRIETGGITEKGMGSRAPEAKPTRREELSSTIPTLDRALPAITNPQLRNDIHAYVDSRIGLRLTAAVLEGDLDYARQLMLLLEGRPLGQARIAATLAKLPRPLARAAVATGRRLKRMMRRG